MTRLLRVMLLAAVLQAAPEPITWNVQSAPPSIKAGARFNVKVVARIQDGWHLYSLKPQSEGPIATRIWISEGQPFSLAGPIDATEPTVLHDATFGMEV